MYLIYDKIEQKNGRNIFKNEKNKHVKNNLISELKLDESNHSSY